MRTLTSATFACLLALSGAASAQTANTQAGANASTSGSQQPNALATANKIKQDMQNAGFTDVKVVAESFVVQAKSKDGDPVLMTVGPHGLSIFETAAAGQGGTGRMGASDQTGSTGTQQVKVSKLTGKQLYNAKGDALGDIERVVRGGDGRDSLVIGHGGLLGLGEKQMAVPLDKVAMNGDRVVAHGVSDDQLKSMPAFTKAGTTEVGGDQTVGVGAGR